jgi:hypothetical protein
VRRDFTKIGSISELTLACLSVTSCSVQYIGHQRIVVAGARDGLVTCSVTNFDAATKSFGML